MKKVISMLAILVMIGALSAGCKDKQADKPSPEATKQSTKSNDQNWEPQTSEQPTTHSAEDGHDHSEHDH